MTLHIQKPERTTAHKRSSGMYNKIITGVIITAWICIASPAIAECVLQCKGNEREADGFCYTVSRGEVTIMAYTGDEQDVVIPESINGMPVTQIGVNALKECENLTSVILPDNIVNIGVNAFRDCSNLGSVILPASLSHVDNNAFRDCMNLSSIHFLVDAPSVAPNAFFGSSDYCIVYYAPEAQGFGDSWLGYPAEPVYPPEEGEQDEPIIDLPPTFICTPVWVGPWYPISGNPAKPDKPRAEHILFWAYDDDQSTCLGSQNRWMYRPVAIIDGEVVPTGEWKIEIPRSYLWFVWIETPSLAELTGHGLFEMNMQTIDCIGQVTDGNEFWGRRFFFEVE
jgi:hypothetical protein